MKAKSAVLLFVVCIMTNYVLVLGGEPPRRNATKVKDADKPYSADIWLVSPDEEPIGDEEVSNAPECDIKGILGAYDDDLIRVDIILENPVSFDWLTVYAILIKYTNQSECYTYHTDTKELIYEKLVDGEVVETKTLNELPDTQDKAGVTSYDGQANRDIYFIISKDHIAGKEGNRYFLTCSFFSGFLDDAGEINIADQTITVEMEFEY